MTTFRSLPLCVLLVGISACTTAGSVPPANTPAAAQAQRPTILFNKQVAALTPPKGVRLAPLSVKYLREAQAWAEKHPLHKGVAFRDGGSAQHLWMSDERNAIWETKATQTAGSTGKKIVGALYDCNAPLGMKVDPAGNLWVACANSGTVNMYKPNATKASLVLQVNRNVGSEQIEALPDDVAFDWSGNVYVGNLYTSISQGSNYTFDNADIDVFLANPSCGNMPCNKATPDIDIVNPHANLPCPASPSGFCQIGIGYSFVDLDAEGNLYHDFYDDVAVCSSKCTVVRSNIGLDVISSPLSTPHYKSLVRKMVSPGGLYVTATGTVLNMLDSGTGKISRYNLFPFKSMGVLGPTPQDPHFSDCIPIAIGFNKSETLVAAGDQNCNAAIVGTVATNKFIDQLNFNYGPLAGAAFQPSDKTDSFDAVRR